ncbi:hypothetical protein CONPUDRAFT_149615 [Coniophora puteana RWD-64-598 SS2]|uniref:Uncharacterized protein n=1 Tax=Coniophora puteana (strain RWD-64-598) TaxID=741705 RepID=A0A5M3N0H5_CONPW|nr:uncharacterized protein CONPUDRAFT_149615 [Coniophora puteana RWD-64-598 SS2]EIW84747.1 hypothetical protein CONPUDRAFT_149615 [Coniophora puteana RWD-64-598 SS2]
MSNRLWSTVLLNDVPPEHPLPGFIERITLGLSQHLGIDEPPPPHWWKHQCVSYQANNDHSQVIDVTANIMLPQPNGCGSPLFFTINLVSALVFDRLRNVQFHASRAVYEDMLGLHQIFSSEVRRKWEEASAQARQAQLHQHELRQEQLRQDQLHQEKMRQDQLRQTQPRQDQPRQDQLHQFQVHQPVAVQPDNDKATVSWECSSCDVPFTERVSLPEDGHAIPQGGTPCVCGSESYCDPCISKKAPRFCARCGSPCCDDFRCISRDECTECGAADNMCSKCRDENDEHPIKDLDDSEELTTITYMCPRCDREFCNRCSTVSRYAKVMVAMPRFVLSVLHRRERYGQPQPQLASSAKHTTRHLSTAYKSVFRASVIGDNPSVESVMYTKALFVLAFSALAASVSATAPAPKITPAPSLKRDSPTCGSDPGAWVRRCLVDANDSNGNACSENDFTCLCNQINANGNFAISEGRCVSDGCFNNPGGGGGSAGYSSASSYQASFCSSAIATPSGTVVTSSPAPTSSA